MKDKILEYLNREIDNLNNQLDIEIEERGLDSLSTFTDLGLDSDGIPRSQGNSDDVYSDGCNYGAQEGNYEALIRIKEYVEAL